MKLIKQLWATPIGRVSVVVLALFLFVLLAPSFKWLIAIVILAVPFCAIFFGADYFRNEKVRATVDGKAKEARDGIKRVASRLGGEK